MKAEQLIVYGANCVWWDSIDKVAVMTTPQMRGPGLPCCPHCGSVLMQVEESKWWKNVADYENGRQPDGQKHPGYRQQMEWMRGRCFPTMTAARAAYEARTPEGN